MILLFKARGWWGPSHGGSHVKRMAHEDGKGGGGSLPDIPSSAHINNAVSAEEYWRKHFAGKTFKLAVVAGKNKLFEYPLSVSFDNENTHMWTRAAKDGEIADAFDQPVKKSGPRVYDSERAPFMDKLLPAIRTPWKILGNRNDRREIYLGSRLSDGRTYIVVLAMKDIGKCDFVSAHPRSKGDVDKLILALRPIGSPAGNKSLKNKKPLIKAAFDLPTSIDDRIFRFIDVGGIHAHQDDLTRPSTTALQASARSKRIMRRRVVFFKAINMERYRPSHEPTEAQLKSGNYKKPVMKWRGLTIRIENPAGSVRRGSWGETRMKYDYGYISGSKGVDGDEVDVYIGPHAESADMVYVVHQRKYGDWQKYDEDKAMIGFMSENEAKAAYLAHYDDDRFLGPVTTMPVEEFIEKTKATKERARMIKSILYIKSYSIQKVQDAKKVILFFKSNVRGHTRRLESGKLVYINPYSNRVAARAQAKNDKQLDLFGDDAHATPKKDAVAEHKRPVNVLPDSLNHGNDGKEAKKLPTESGTDRSGGIDLAEDREDLADEMMRNPHSDKARELVRRIAEKEKSEVSGVSAAGDEDNPNSPNYRYRDTGYVAGSRKELAANVIRQAAKTGRRVNANEVDWKAIEENPREARELITKSNLFGEVPWETLREQGMEPGAGFLIDRVYASIGTGPAEDAPQARKDYAYGLQTLRDRLERCKTANEVISTIGEMKDESRGVMLADGDAEKYQSLDGLVKELYGRIHELDEKRDIAYAALRNADSAKYGIENEIEKRQRRKWKVSPEMQAELKEVTKHAEDANKIFESVRNESNPVIEHLKKSVRAAAMEMHEIMERAVARNAAENPLTRAWSVMGERFNAVLNFRSGGFIYRGKRVSGSEAFRNHVVAAKSGRIKDWEWAESKGVTKAPRVSKESVRFQLKVADHFDRIGGRKIKPETTSELKNLFNLREVQSGNWVLRDPVSAGFHVENTAAAFADLADIIGVPDRDVSLNGRLAMAFGARGSGAKGWKDGAPKAHYEPVHRIINLTKMGGGGSLGHEWSHALDNMIAEAVTGKPAGVDDFASENPELLPSGELRDAFIAVRSAMLDGDERASKTLTYTGNDLKLADYNINRQYPNEVAKRIKAAGNADKAVQAVDDFFDGKRMTPKVRKQIDDWSRIAVAYHDRNPDGNKVKVKAGPPMSKFAAGAKALDAGGGSPYWHTAHEMFARAFQSYIEDTLSSMGRKNDYLSSYADNKYHADPLFGIQWKPYPEGEERERINIAMERLLAAVRKHDVLAKAAAMFDRGEVLMAG